MASDKDESNKLSKAKLIKIASSLPAKERFLRNLNCFYPGQPMLFANCRYYCQGDMPAAILLMYVMYRWQAKKRFSKFGKEWIVMSAEEWAFASGLTLNQFHKAALPRIRHREFIEIRQGKISPMDKQKKMFIRLMPDNFPLTYGEEWQRYVLKHFYRENPASIILD